MVAENSESSKEVLQNRKNRKVILGIFAVPAFVIVLSSVLYFLVDNKAVDLGTVNNGQLIVPPQQFAELPLKNLAGEDFDFSQPEPKWAFVVMGDQFCENDCERMLYIARQSIIALAKRMGRVRLLYISEDGVISSSLQERLELEYKGIDVVTIAKSTMQDLLKDSDTQWIAEKRFYVVDQRGWMMMYYQVEDTSQDKLNTLGKAVVRDMKRLLK